MKKKLLAVMMLVAGSAFAETHFSIGVGIGTPGYAPAPYAVAARPPFPGPGFVWIDGYYDAYGRFIPGYWARPPYQDSFWIAPSYFGGHYTTGYWGRRGVVRNDFRNDFRGRDFDRNRGFQRNDYNRGNDNRGFDNRGNDNRGNDNRGFDNRGNDNRGNDNRGQENRGRSR